MSDQKIATCLWFDGKAEEAVEFYTSIFRNSKVANVMRHGDVGPGRKGSVLTMTFELEGREFIALNGGPHFKFTEAISMFVKCETQAEVDELWEKLGAGGEPGQCGWLKDKFGLSWQIVPIELQSMLQSQDGERSNRVMAALMQMRKLDLTQLKAAYEGR